MRGHRELRSYQGRFQFRAGVERLAAIPIAYQIKSKGWSARSIHSFNPTLTNEFTFGSQPRVADG
jgi:hypothetical protein